MMGIRDLAIRQSVWSQHNNSYQNNADGGVPITTSSDLERVLRYGVESSSGELVNEHTALMTPTVNACVRLISGTIANMPLHLKRRIDDRNREDATDHSLWNVLRRKPNSWMKPSAFRKLLTTHVLLRGNAYALIVRSRGRVIEIIPLHPDRVSVEQLNNLSLEYTYTRKDGSRYVVPQNDMMHLMGMSLDGIKGLSVIGAARETIGLARATERHGNTLFKNGTNLGGLLKYPGPLADKARENLKESLKDYRGSDNAHKLLILEEGAGFERLGLTNEDAQYIETRKFTRSEICMFFGVPPSMVGDNSNSDSNWGTGLEQKSRGFVAYTLQDWITLWEDAINCDLLDDSETDIFARFNKNSLISGDTKAQNEAFKAGRLGGWLTNNDIRGLMDLNPIEGGDDPRQPLNSNSTSEKTEDSDVSKNTQD